MKRIVTAVLLCFILIFPIAALASETDSDTSNPQIDIPSQMQQNMQEADPGFDFETCLKDVKDGKMSFNTLWLLDKISSVFLKEIKSCMKIMVAIIIIGALFSIISSMDSDGMSSVSYYACLLVLFGLIIAAFMIASSDAREVVQSVCTFMKSLLMVLFTYLATSGSFITAGVFSATFLVVLQIFDDIILNILIPLTMLILALSFINALYEKPVLSSMIDLMKSISKYIISFMFIVFLGMAALQGSLSTTFEGISTKSAKFVVKSLPLVGNLLSDSVDVVLSSSVLIKNSIGAAGIIAVVTAVMVPVLKMAALILIFRLGGAILEIIAGEKFSRCLRQSGDALTILLGCVLSVFAFSLVAIGVILAVGNAALVR